MATFTLQLDRTLAVDMVEVRTSVLEALRDLDFHMTTSQITLLEARRGTKMTGGLLGTKNLPVLVRVILSAEEGGSRLRAVISDDLLVPIGAGFGATYEGRLRQVQEGIDLALSRLDPAAAKDFDLPHFDDHGKSNAGLEKFMVAVSEKSENIGDSVSNWLGGGKSDNTPEAWRGVHSVRFESPAGSAVMDPDTVEGLLTVAAMVMSQPASLPAPLRHDLAQFAATVEQSLGVQRWGEAVIPVSAEEKPVFEFMNRQAMLREHLPIRTVHRCRACAFERITNPDYEELKKRNEKLRGAMGMVGASISGRGLSPFVLVGSVFKLKRLDPEYVCPRCQGLEAEERIVTFCPQCGEMRGEAALRVCPKCKYDFRTLLEPQPIWKELPPAPTASLPPPGQRSLPPGGDQTEETADQVRTVATPGVCPHCGAPLVRGVLLCWSCKTRLVWDSSPTPVAPVPAQPPASLAGKTTVALSHPCPECGVGRDRGAKFCENCGARFEGDLAEAPTLPTSASQPPSHVAIPAMPDGALLVATPGVCPACGSKIYRGVKFCWKCKASLRW